MKQLYVGNEDTLGRKLKEAYLAWQLEHKRTKDQILTKYLNTVYFGNGAYGVEAAAQTYFNEAATSLTLPQAALLAGLVRAPVNYDPVTHPTHARQRRSEVLQQMLEQGMIDEATFAKTVATPVELDLGTVDEQRYPAPYFVDYFKEWFLSNPRFGATPQERYDLLFKGGLRITTSIDLGMQAQAEHAVHTVLPYKSDPYAAMTVIDPRNGEVKAMVGGRNYWDTRDPFARINLATGGSTGRQTGSSFKPFALVAALENGFTPSSPLNGSSASIPLPNGTVWQPHNAEGGGVGTISLESATVNSVNVAYANLEVQLGGGDAFAGAQKIIEVAKRMGIRCCPRTTEPSTPLIAVPRGRARRQRGEPARDGIRVRDARVRRSASATDAGHPHHRAGGTVLYESQPKPNQVVNPAVISVADGILQKVVQYGTGTAANIGRPQIGKTGTEDLYRDAWFVGAVPQLVAAVWVGFPQGQISMAPPTTRITVFGGTWPAQIWHAFMAAATAHMPVRSFPTGPAIEYVTLRVDVTQGCLANPFTPPADVRTFQYIVGTEPDKKVCKEPSSYQSLTVPSVVGLLKDAAITALHNAGFNVSIVFEPSSGQPEGTVLSQDPSGGSQLLQTATVTITVAKGSPSPSPSIATVPDVVGLTRGAASAALQGAGFVVSVVLQQECDPADPLCDYRQGLVWTQSPGGGRRAAIGSTVTIVVNP